MTNNPPLLLSIFVKFNAIDKDANFIVRRILEKDNVVPVVGNITLDNNLFSVKKFR